MHLGWCGRVACPRDATETDGHHREEARRHTARGFTAARVAGGRRVHRTGKKEKEKGGRGTKAAWTDIHAGLPSDFSTISVVAVTVIVTVIVAVTVKHVRGLAERLEHRLGGRERITRLLVGRARADPDEHLADRRVDEHHLVGVELLELEVAARDLADDDHASFARARDVRVVTRRDVILMRRTRAAVAWTAWTNLAPTVSALSLE